MRLFLLPISKRQTLIYCKRLNVSTTSQQGWLDKGTARAAKLWSDWEKKEKGWQKRVVDYGNQALKRIPFEEWGLKSIPPLSARRKDVEGSREGKVEVLFPPSLIPETTAKEVLLRLGTERQGLHRSRMYYSFIGMPISAPFALIPIIPNLPFFYLVYRAWSHWRALSGSRHIQHLVQQDQIIITPSQVLDDIYGIGRKQRQPIDSRVVGASAEDTSAGAAAQLVLERSSRKLIAQALEVPELEMELERAMWQVTQALAAKQPAAEDRGSGDEKARDGDSTSRSSASDGDATKK